MLIWTENKNAQTFLGDLCTQAERLIVLSTHVWSTPRCQGMSLA